MHVYKIQYGNTPHCARGVHCLRGTPHGLVLLGLGKMSDSVEYRTLSRCRDKLVTAFKLDSVTIADAFVSQSLISATIASEVNELATSEQKARRLVDCVFGQVLISDTQYDKFMSVFSQLDWLKDLVRILNSTHSKLVPCLQGVVSKYHNGLFQLRPLQIN